MSSSRIFLVQNDGSLVGMSEQRYDAEETLQSLLAQYPDLLSGDQIDPQSPRRWLLVQREVGIPADEAGRDWWAVDHLFLDQDAVPTFVEVKRSTDTRIRREVVGQMLDYAANAITLWPVARMRAQFEADCERQGQEPDTVLAEFLGDATDLEAFWEQAQRNLQAGQIRLLFVADEIPARLRRIVEFLNRQMSPAEVLAVEVRQFVSGNDGDALRTLVPRIVGQTEEAKQAKVSPRSVAATLTEEEFYELLSPEHRPTVQDLARGFKEIGFERTIRVTQTGHAWMYFSVPGIKSAPLSIGWRTLYVSLGRYHPPLGAESVKEELRQRIASIAPHLKQVNDPAKTEIGLPLESLSTPVARDGAVALAAYLHSILTSNDLGERAFRDPIPVDSSS